MADETGRRHDSRSAQQKRIAKLNAEAAKTYDAIARRVLIQEAADLRRDTPDEMKAPRLWTGDVTPERLQNLLAEHGERMSVISDEGGIFEVMGGLYSNG